MTGSAVVDAGRRLVLDAPPREVAPGIRGVRLALPFALDHVNLWQVDDGDGCTLIDAGLADDRSRARWQELLAELAPPSRLIVTHFHPDHMGLAGWLCGETGIPLWTTRTEWLMARMLGLDISPGFVEAGRASDLAAGLPDELIGQRARRGNAYRPKISEPPARYRRVVESEQIQIGGVDYQVMIGRGHAPEMICLYAAETGVLIAADQILPRISPNVSVWGSEPLADPLGDFLTSLQSFEHLPEDTLVLPSHGHPFYGLHARIDQLAGHHEERLARALELCSEPTTAATVMRDLFDRPLDQHQIGFAIGETLAHLNHLVARGHLTVERDGARNLYRRI
ncbi:MAG: MBL fold metallo-hydrolase [Geminicoccaceae bacterium]|nr:MBL fold metallo-hydrolase [Geminicoccaceae bacterium]